MYLVRSPKHAKRSVGWSRPSASYSVRRTTTMYVHDGLRAPSKSRVLGIQYYDARTKRQGAGRSRFGNANYRPLAAVARRAGNGSNAAFAVIHPTLSNGATEPSFQKSAVRNSRAGHRHGALASDVSPGSSFHDEALIAITRNAEGLGVPPDRSPVLDARPAI